MLRRLCVGLLLPVVTLSMAVAQGGESGFLNRTLTLGGEVYRYQVFVPFDYTPARTWPLVLFLHGGGERGEDGLLQTEIGLGGAIRRHADRYPAIVVFPQRRARRWDRREVDVSLKALEQSEREFRTDPDRVYLTGLSSGAEGAYYLASRDPGRFAAILAACGKVSSPVLSSGGDIFRALALKLRIVPLWVFHGEADTVVSVEESRQLVAALHKLGSEVRYTELPGVGHNSWDAAYQSAEVPAWLFAQRRRGRFPRRLDALRATRP